jgi:hypothetical protein
MRILTSSSPLRHEDSFCKTAMSRREDIVSCIDVTIMDRSAHSALPSPYSKIFPAFGAGAAVTHAAGLGGKCFIDYLEPHACVIAFVRQHGSERTPSRIEHRLRQSGLCQRGGVHVANEDSTVALHQAGAQFMQEIFSPICDLGVNRSGSVSMPGALCAGEGGFQVAVKALGLDRPQSLITERGKRPQPQIDAQTRDRAIEERSDRRFISLFPDSLRARHTNIEIPAPAAIFAEVTGTQFKVTNTIAVPQRQPTSREVNLSPLIANRSDLKGNPAQGASRTAALAPGESHFPVLSAPPRVFFRDILYRLGGKMQGAITARDPFEKRPEINSRQKPSLALEHFDRQFVAIVENRVDLARQAAKPRSVLVLHPQAQGPNRGGSRTGHPYSILKEGPSHHTSANIEKGESWVAYRATRVAIPRRPEGQRFSRGDRMNGTVR